MPSSIKSVKNSDDETEDINLTFVPIKNIVIIDISAGKRPLHGTRLFVIIASSLSLCESIILHPTTPAALQPNPIHMVSACFPHAQHFLKGLSRLYAILGRYPKSSKSVNSGKNIAIGGSITETIHAKVRYAPETSISDINFGTLSAQNRLKSLPSNDISSFDKIADG